MADSEPRPITANQLVAFIASKEPPTGVARLNTESICEQLNTNKKSLERARDKAIQSNRLIWVRMSKNGSIEDAYATRVNDVAVKRQMEVAATHAGGLTRSTYGFRNHKIGAGA